MGLITADGNAQARGACMVLSLPAPPDVPQRPYCTPLSPLHPDTAA